MTAEPVPSHVTPAARRPGSAPAPRYLAGQNPNSCETPVPFPVRPPEGALYPLSATSLPAAASASGPCRLLLPLLPPPLLLLLLLGGRPSGGVMMRSFSETEVDDEWR